MGVTRVAYEADGWGVGELWLDGDVVVWHELPRSATRLQSNRVAHPYVKLVQRYLAGANVDLESGMVAEGVAQSLLIGTDEHKQAVEEARWRR